MTRYSELYYKQLEESAKLKNELQHTREYRDRYLRFIQEDGHQIEFMRWYAKDLGISDDFSEMMPTEAGLS